MLTKGYQIVLGPMCTSDQSLSGFFIFMKIVPVSVGPWV